jgi:hypothetical protein
MSQTLKISGIAWRTYSNANGSFEASEDFDNPNHQALLKLLKEQPRHRLVSGGYYYWIYPMEKLLGARIKSIQNPKSDLHASHTYDVGICLTTFVMLIDEKLKSPSKVDSFPS